MNILIFGASGMLGQAVLRESLNAPDVQLIRAICRAPTGFSHPKYDEIIHADFTDLKNIEASLSNFDTCFFSMGVSASGKSETEYTHLNYDIPLSVAKTLSRLNPQMTFVYVSGAGTDSSAQGKSMWARVKGRTENDLQTLPFKRVFLFRPGIIRPLNGIRSKTKAYGIFYKLSAPLLWVLQFIIPHYILSTEIIGQVFLIVARKGAAKAILESADIFELTNRIY
jgi:uncharacterized protein YbjT (DUF2867 family)